MKAECSILNKLSLYGNGPLLRPNQPELLSMTHRPLHRLYKWADSSSPQSLCLTSKKFAKTFGRQKIKKFDFSKRLTGNYNI